MRAARAMLVAAVAAAWACWLIAAPAVAAACAVTAGRVGVGRDVSRRRPHLSSTGSPFAPRRRRADAGVCTLLRPVRRRRGGRPACGGVGARRAPASQPAAGTMAVGGGGVRASRRSLRGAASTSPAWRCPAAARALLAVPLGAAVAAIVTLWAGGAAFDDTALPIVG